MPNHQRRRLTSWVGSLDRRLVVASVLVLGLGCAVAWAVLVASLRDNIGFPLYITFVTIVGTLAVVGYRHLLEGEATKESRARASARNVLAALDQLRAAFGSDPRYVTRPTIEMLAPLADAVRRAAAELEDSSLRTPIERAVDCAEYWFLLERAGVGSPRYICRVATETAWKVMGSAVRGEAPEETPRLNAIWLALQKAIEDRHAADQGRVDRRPRTVSGIVRIARDRLHRRRRYPSEFD